MNAATLEHIKTIESKIHTLQEVNVSILQLSLACAQVGVGMHETLRKNSSEISEISRVLLNSCHKLKKEYNNANNIKV